MYLTRKMKYNRELRIGKEWNGIIKWEGGKRKKGKEGISGGTAKTKGHWGVIRKPNTVKVS